jgi:signal transduction histidine kinase
MKSVTKLSILLNLCFSAALAVAISLIVTADRADTIERGYKEAESLNAALAQQMSQILGLAIATLRVHAADINAQGYSSDTAETILTDNFLTSVQEIPSLFGLYVIDRNGYRAVSTDDRLTVTADMREAPEYKAALSDPFAEVITSPPRMVNVFGDPDDDTWVWMISMPILNAAGQFDGVLSAAVSVDALASTVASHATRYGAVAGVMTNDGYLVARAPLDRSLLGKNISDRPIYQEARRAALARTRSISADGIERYLVAQTIPRFDAYVYVGHSISFVLAPWWTRSVLLIAMGATASLLAALMSYLIFRSQRIRRDLEQERLRRGNLLASASINMVQIEHADAVLQFANITALALTQGRTSTIQLFACDCHNTQSMFPPTQHAINLMGTPIQSRLEATRVSFVLSDVEMMQMVGPTGSADPLSALYLITPVTGKLGEVLGAVIIGREKGQFDSHHQAEIAQLASVMATCIENLLLIENKMAALEGQRAARSQMQAVLSSITDPVFALDNDWRIVYFNHAAEEDGWQPADRIIGSIFWEVFPEAVETEVFGEYQRSKSSGQPTAFDFYLPLNKRNYFVSAFPHEEGLTVYYRDVTSQKDLESRVRQQQKLTAIGQLTGGIAHDFNNILTVIIGCTEALLDNAKDLTAPAVIQLNMIKQAGDRAAELTHRLLAFARRQPLNPQVSDIVHLLHEAVPLAQISAGGSVTLDLSTAPSLWKAAVDRGELQNALLNLVLNARDAMPNGGRVLIEATNRTFDETVASDREIRAGDYVMVAVSDTGVGMSAEQQLQAFEPFYTTKRPGEGSGLGLPMVYGFAKQTGGDVRIYSELGIGTTIAIYLPRATDEAAGASDVHIAAPVIGGKGRVLLVEDDDLVRMHTEACLRKLGYESVSVPDGNAALSVLHEGEVFEILLTDVVLPGGLNGKQVADAASSHLPSIKIVYMSGYTENSIVHHGRLDPGITFLSKPFRLSELDAKLREVVDGLRN